ncbi:nucleotidyl transferase AbiEii/AbiGii toxin family protein [Jonesiaceae bacterium BS-20]|uniref:Nucleotidyl transferase AbiEii/AbiGii toxin family protein n=1 Tax=Jonesiaceae bacterium BS-20 TaxID=3120821 RepID=A0AAU7E0P5_9MICO
MLNRAELQRRRAKLNKSFKQVAIERGSSEMDVRKQFVFALFWKRLYLGGDPGWLLLGGNALLIRTGGGRHTSDIDFARDEVWEDPAELHKELQEKLRAGNDLDDFILDVVNVKPHADPDALGYGTKTAAATIVVSLGGKEFDRFKVDITSRKFIDSTVDLLPLQPVFADPALEKLPAIPTVPVEHHVADKIAALYDTYGKDGGPSTRYRDLADLVRIFQGPLPGSGQEITVDAARLRAALVSEIGRRKMVWPTQFSAPGPLWLAEFPRLAAQYAQYPSDFMDLAAALAYVSEVLGDVLTGVRTNGVWHSAKGTWI